MVYSPVKDALLRLLKAPTEPPDPPAGSHASVQVFRASPKFLTYRLLVLFLVSAFLAFVGLFVFLIVLFEGGLPGAVLVALIAMLVFFFLSLAYVHVRIDYDMRYYIVTDRSLRIREGAFIIKEMTLTYANVQNLRLKQGPIERFFGIQNLMVDTAGGGAAAAGTPVAGGHNFQMAGVANAKEVRDLVLSYMKVVGGGSGLGDLDDPGERAGRGVAAGPGALAALRGVRDAAASLRAAAESA